MSTDDTRAGEVAAEEVEAAAIAQFGYVYPRWTWDACSTDEQDDFRNHARIALAAVLPARDARVRAEAWEVGVKDGRQSGMLRTEPRNPYDGSIYPGPKNLRALLGPADDGEAVGSAAEELHNADHDSHRNGKDEQDHEDLGGTDHPNTLAAEGPRR